jgi:hypothetical protein
MRSSDRGAFAAGVCAIILAAAIGITWVAVPIAALIGHISISDRIEGSVNGIGQVMVGAVAVYIGAQLPTRRRAAIEPHSGAHRESDGP